MTDDRTCPICGCHPVTDEHGLVHWYHQHPECGASLRRFAADPDNYRHDDDEQERDR